MAMTLAMVLALVAPVAAEDPRVVFDVDPRRCAVEPRSLDELERILAVGTPQPPARTAPGTPISAGSETGHAVSATIEMLVSCLNAGDRLRAYALYTDAYLATILRPGDLPEVATPYPADTDEYTDILAIEPRQVAEDRVIAKVTLDPALIPVDKIFEFILIPVDGEWRIDGVINEIDFSLP
ncbi:MAG: hypothetical protein KC438_07960 [Thermomicrobiales bacterium]|nr:hypothetical protein [Thermomicrobiales bacterium]MCO5221783.1 hypothetical protein [Thermomicrobiales bacterium]